MFYLILALLLLLFYIFFAPNHIKGTLNIMGGVIGLVLVLLVLTLALLKFLESPPEIFIALGMTPLAYFSIRDMERLQIKTKS